MRVIFFFILLIGEVKANTYYISSSTGSDLFPGTQASPWARPKSFLPGNTYLFKRGDVFYNISLPAAGSLTARINIGHYGSGANPVFNMFATIKGSAWTNYSGFIWRAQITSSLYVDGTVPKRSNCGMIVIGGEKFGVRRGKLSGLSGQWQFFCDFGNYIYVYSSVNPSLISNWIMVSTDERPINGMRYMTIDGIQIWGCATASFFADGALYDTIRHCHVKYGGGEMKSAFDSTRQGNGITLYNGGINAFCYYDSVVHVYDEAFSWQSHSSGSLPIGFTNCSYRKCFSDSNEASFNPSIAVPGAPGYFNCKVDSNIFKHEGWSWSHNVRPKDNEAITILNNFWLQGTGFDIIIEHNTFICPREGVYKMAASASDPRFTSRFNTIYLDPNVLIRKNFNGASVPFTYKLATYPTFTSDQGYEVSSTWLACNEAPPDDTSSVLPVITFYQDLDGDKYGNPAVSATGSYVPPGYVLDNTDCDDMDPTVHPGATELPDGKDNNCDGIVDNCSAIRHHGG